MLDALRAKLARCLSEELPWDSWPQKLQQERFRLAIGKKFLSKWAVGHWNRLPRAVGESPFLERLKRCVDGWS